MLKNNDAGTKSGFNNLKAVYRLLISLLLAALFYFLVPEKSIDGFTHLMSAWDIFSLCMIVLTWITFITTGAQQIRQLAKLQDESRSIIFIIVLISNITGLLAVLLLLISKDAARVNQEVHLLVAISGMVLSWLLVHTIFTLRYAHLYYGDSLTEPTTHAGGLDFPGDGKPDYIDFAYFSFVLGMTFQVSDVEITSGRIRKIALMHGLLSFGYNTIVVALTINIIAGLTK